jgi:hypothetical protein
MNPEERVESLLAVGRAERIATQDVKSAGLVELPYPRLLSASTEAREGKSPDSARRLLADLRWAKRFVHFLELSGVGRTLADGVDEESAYASRIDTWIAWETEEVTEVERLTARDDG